MEVEGKVKKAFDLTLNAILRFKDCNTGECILIKPLADVKVFVGVYEEAVRTGRLWMP